MSVITKIFDTSAVKDVHFIIGAPRSGTTWLQYSLNLHPQVFCAENRFFGNFAEMWPDNNGAYSVRITLDEYIQRHSHQVPVNAAGSTIGKYQDLLLTNMIKATVKTIRQISGKKYLIDKITPYLGTSDRVVEQIFTRFPSAKLVYLARDGRDVLTSGTFDWLKKDAEGTDRHRYFIMKERNFTLRRFFDDELIALWSRYWTEPYQALVDSRHAYLQIKYEQMLETYANVFGSVLKYFDIGCTAEQISKCEQLSDYQVMSGGRVRGENSIAEKQRKGIAGDWRSYFTRRDGLLFQELAGKQLQALGYVHGPEWTDALPDRLDLTPLN